MHKKEDIPARKGKRYIFRASIKLKDGTVLYAKNYGKKAFRIEIS